MRFMSKVIAVLAGVVFSAQVLASTSQAQQVREMIQGVYVENRFDPNFGQVNYTYTIAYSDNNLIIIENETSLPGIEVAEVMPEAGVVTFWFANYKGKRGLATIRSLFAGHQLQLILPDGNSHRMNYVRPITAHDEKVIHKAVLGKIMPDSLLDRVVDLMVDEGLEVTEAVEKTATTAEIITIRMNEVYNNAIAQADPAEKKALAKEQQEVNDKLAQCADEACKEAVIAERILDLEEFLWMISRTPGGMQMN